MSAIGPKQTSPSALHMSAFGAKADMAFCGISLSRSLLGVKRTWAVAPHMSDYDPKQTSPAPSRIHVRVDTIRCPASGAAMRRRDFIKLTVGSAAAWPFTSHAQEPERVRRIGVFLPRMEGHNEARHRFEVFRDGLKQLGWVEGRNVHFDVRSVGGKREVMQTATAEILALRPDVILANGATVLSTLLQHTRTVPIVFVQVADPVAGGFVTSLAKPGGNVTGFVNFEYAIAGKWVTLLREIAPRANHITAVLDPLLGTSAGVLGAVQAVCSALGLQLNAISVRDGTEIDHAFSALAHELDTGFIVLPGPTSTTNYERF